MKKRMFAYFLIFTLILGLAGCSGSGSRTETGTESTAESADEKETVSVALWSDQMMRTYAPWLQEKFPDVNFVFYSATNSADYYQTLAEKGELPDILTVRRFSLKDVEGFRDELMELSETDLAQGFYQSYLRNYTYSDGTVNWLPACAELDDIIINKTLFEENSIEIPTDWESFVDACKAFEEIGITGYVTDLAYDYTCMETLQGFSVGSLASTEGYQWRKAYESGETNQLSEEVWMPVFEKMTELLDVTGMDESTLDLTTADIREMFAEGKVAMFRGGVQNMELVDDTYETMLLPYPGDTESESFYLTYPVFQVAAKQTESDEREELILEIMTAMLSEEGLNSITSDQNIIAYNRDVEMTLSENLENLKPYVDENRIFIRLATSDMFSVSQTVVQQMLRGELSTAQEAFDEFNRILKENETAEEEPVVAHIDTAYSRAFTDEHGNQAASALFNTVREELGVDCMIAQSAAVGTDITTGDYTESELNYLLNYENAELQLLELTGEELAEYVEFYLNAKQTCDSVVNDNTLPVASGFEMTISRTDDGYHLEKITINGEAVDASKTYTVASWNSMSVYYTGDETPDWLTDYEKSDTSPDACIYKRLAEDGGQLCAPTDYITLN